MTVRMGNSSYETYAERDGVKYEIVDTGEVGLFGQPIIRACTLQEVMRPTMSRRTLGTFRTRTEAKACLDAALGEFAASKQEG